MFREVGCSKAISENVHFGDATVKTRSSRGAWSISMCSGELKGGHVGVGNLRISKTSSAMASVVRREGEITRAFVDHLDFELSWRGLAQGQFLRQSA